MKVLPLKDISKIEMVNNRISVTYSDGMSRTILSDEDITFDLNYSNQSDIPLNDHCT